MQNTLELAASSIASVHARVPRRTRQHQDALKLLHQTISISDAGVSDSGA
jgi:hypothetical protein